LGERYAHTVIFEHARQREDVANIVVDDEHMLTREDCVCVVQPLEHAPFLLRQLRLYAVQEERRLIQQPLRALDVLYDDGVSESSSASFVTGFSRYAMAPAFIACCRSRIPVMMCTGMCRVSG